MPQLASVVWWADGKRPSIAHRSVLAHLSEGQDTSDAFISPYVVGIDGSAEAAARIVEWAANALRVQGVAALRLWFTEGFDDAFEQVECRVHDLADILRSRLNDSGDVPSMHFRVRA
jgi:hypothetical protein